MKNRPALLLAATWLTFASSAAIIVSISASQILLGLALVALIASRERVRLPPIQLPLGLFLLGTLIAVGLSDNPAAAFPQIKKLYVFCQLLVAYTLLRQTKIARWLILTWASCAAASALLGLVQFGVKAYRIHEAHQDFYAGYVDQRITGFMSHWYTFSVEEMLVLLMLAAFLFFSPEAARHMWLWIALAIAIGLGVLLAETRAVWLATLAGMTYLVWCWRPRLILAIPVLIVLAIVVAPSNIRQRVVSIVHPAHDDSNGFRFILMRTGLRMVEAHPWFGLGPEMPRKEFMEYLPADIPKPLPAGSYMHLHNIYLEYAAERGLPVLLVFLWLMGQILWDFMRGIRALPRGPDEGKFLLHGGIAVVIALLIEGFADVNLGDSEDLTIFLVVIALAYNALAKDNRCEAAC